MGLRCANKPLGKAIYRRRWSVTGSGGIRNALWGGDRKPPRSEAAAEGQ